MKPCSPLSLGLETGVAESTSPPELSASESQGKLEVVVLFTCPKSTLAALRRAATLLNGLEARVSLIEVQAIPYPLPLNMPPVALDFTKRRLLGIASESQLEIAAYVYLTRFRWETLAQVLKPGSVVFIGCQKTWWPSGEKKLARRLQRSGYSTVVVEAR